MVQEPKPEEPVAEDELVSEEEAAPSVSEMRDRVGSKASESIDSMKDSGWRPALDLLGIYAERISDGFVGMAEGFAGKRRKK